MQISRVYSNMPHIFHAVDFNFGERAGLLNVILGEVKSPKDMRKDSHNLGKTTFLHVIDFLLLKGWSQEHFFYKHRDRFDGFVFYIEIALIDGGFATIQRSVSAPAKVALTRHVQGNQDFSDLTDEEWEHPDLSVSEAVRLLDAWLDLRILKPYNYRMAITYFLRSQGDWSDELQLQKFQAGRDIYWKPFIAHLFGFDQTLIIRKYELDESISKLKQLQTDQQSAVQLNEDDLPGLIAKIEVLEQQVNELENQLDNFQFDNEEKRIVTDLVGAVEQEISTLNQLIYNLRYDIRQIDDSLSHKDKFDLKEIEGIFNEANLHFPSQLKKGYTELVEFKKKVTQERNGALKKRRKELLGDLEQAEENKKTLDMRREWQLRFLRNTDTFEKFKVLQKDLATQRASVVYLDEQRKKLEIVAETARQVRADERERGRIVDEIKAMMSKNTPIYEKFKRIFNEYCQRVLKHEGMFFFRVNTNNNVDYELTLGLSGHKGATSSQGEGTTYKKLVCALFDLALLKVYEDLPFFHFVYHDGIFEASDNRIKIAFLDLVREQTSTGKLQYIMTAIETDLPRSDEDDVIRFNSDEIILRLHDTGQDGRLFKMSEF